MNDRREAARRRRARRRLLLAGALLVAATAAAIGVAVARNGAPRPAKQASPPVKAIRGIDERGNLTTFRRTYKDLLAEAEAPGLVRRLSVPYVASNGARRVALVVLPVWYGPRRHPPIPLVISPHGRGVRAKGNLRYWRSLPAYGPFALVSPEGQGRRLTLFSWGWKKQIHDLARMPDVLSARLPWLRIDRKRIYAVGSSMGGQETLMLVARHPKLLAGAAALDSATDMKARYIAFPRLSNGKGLQAIAREEIGGTPDQVAREYEERSPVNWAPQIAGSGVPLQIWWSTRDQIVTNQRDESGRMYRLIKQVDPKAPVKQFIGSWLHSREFYDLALLPLALVRLGLIELSQEPPPSYVP